jgi:hypothetical protein
VVQSAVVDSPRHNKPALADALTRLVVRYVGRSRAARGELRSGGTPNVS